MRSPLPCTHTRLLFPFLSRVFLSKFLLIACLIAGAQTQVKVVPPSPISASFERYGDYPVGMLSGVPEINIPLYTIESGGIKLPVSLSYHASGIKVNDISFP